MSNESNTNTDAVDVTQLEEGAVVTVSTRNSTYRLTIRDGQHRLASIEGGPFFAEPMVGRIEGTPFEDGPIQVGIIRPGKRLEFFANQQRILTSPVRALNVAA